MSILKIVKISCNCTKKQVFSSSNKDFNFIVFHNKASVEANDLAFDASSGAVFLREPGLQLEIKPIGNYSLSYSSLSFRGSIASKLITISRNGRSLRSAGA